MGGDDFLYDIASPGEGIERGCGSLEMTHGRVDKRHAQTIAVQQMVELPAKHAILAAGLDGLTLSHNGECVHGGLLVSALYAGSV
jgi:hypothetical protein